MTNHKGVLDAAYRLLRNAVVEFEGKPVGTVASLNPEVPAENYREVFVRDFVPGAMVFLLDGEFDIVRNFLRTVLSLKDRQQCLDGHRVVPGVMPASFKIVKQDDGEEEIDPDFGDRAIGRVAPVDSIMWWVGILARYVEATGDMALAREPSFQRGLRSMLDLLMKDRFEIFPTLLTPDGSFMIDRRMGVYGHPLEVQALFYGALRFIPYLLEPSEENRHVLEVVAKRKDVLREYVRQNYWLDLARLNEIHRFKTEEFGTDAKNLLNIYPESIPSWLQDWLPDDAGYLAGNIGPGRIDFRYFALGNLLAVSTDLATEEESERILRLYERHWDDLVGLMPLKICFPAVEGEQWEILTGCDPKNVPWSYHNGGSWPCLLWAFTGAALRCGRRDMAERAFDIAARQLEEDGWPEYYDGKRGRLIGRRASFQQVWTASALILSHKMLERPDILFRVFAETNRPE